MTPLQQFTQDKELIQRTHRVRHHNGASTPASMIILNAALIAYADLHNQVNETSSTPKRAIDRGFTTITNPVRLTNGEHPTGAFTKALGQIRYTIMWNKQKFVDAWLQGCSREFADEVIAVLIFSSNAKG